MTANDLIVRALLHINSVVIGENPTAQEAAIALGSLNNMVDGWQTERLMLWAIQRQEFPLVASQQTYAMGPGSPDWNVPRPVRIDRMSTLSYSNPAQPLELPIEYLTESQWSLIPVKDVLSALPRRCWDDQAFPWRNISFWPIPSGDYAVSALVYSWQTITAFVDLVTDYEFPPGYADALEWNLAVRLSSDFGGFMPPTVVPIAAETKAKVKSVNIPAVDLRCDDALIATGKRQYNWLSDTPIGSR